MRTDTRDSVYDKLRPLLDASDILSRLGVEKVRTLGNEAYCRPLCHESNSGESLQINLHTGRWNCKSCGESLGVKGDLFQLVEYVQTGGRAPSRGAQQGSSPDHRAAVSWLCEQYGVVYDSGRLHGDPGLDIVHIFSMAAAEYLLTSAPEVLAWVQDKWGYDLETVQSYCIGYMPSPILPMIANEAAQPGSREAFRMSGIGWYSPDGRWHTRLEGRVIFPYLEHGRAQYIIGRAVPQTPALADGRTPPKYHKLSVHSDSKPWISEKVTNDHLYNETVMATCDTVVVAEGVADAVALSALGIDVVSPVTISFNATDLERFTRKASENGIRRVDILFDNELSGSGNWAARRVGEKLVERGLATRILTLPLGDDQKQARDEIVRVIGQEQFDAMERAEPSKRKHMLLEFLGGDETKMRWVLENVGASKIDAAEWVAQAGAAALPLFKQIQRKGQDVLDLMIEEIAASELDPEASPSERLEVFADVIRLAAFIKDRLVREEYAGHIADAAGRGVPKAEVRKLVAEYRRDVVKPGEKEDKKKVDHAEAAREMVLLPPDASHTQAATLAPPPVPGGGSTATNAPAAPPPPGQKIQTEHQRLAPARASVGKAVEARLPDEAVGEYIAQTITRSMGFTPFRTPASLFLVRGSERVDVDGHNNRGMHFKDLLYMCSGLVLRKSAHAGYIASSIYFLSQRAKRTDDVSWSHVAGEAIYFPTGDKLGTLLKIEPGRTTKTRMAEVAVPAVAGEDFRPFTYTDNEGGIARAIDLFGWTSLAPLHKRLLVYWLVCLPVLRKIGTVPIVRVEGGSASGKTRAVDAVAMLVNGGKSSSVPTAAAMASRLANEMLTIDDNRESRDVGPDMIGTLLQATHLGAKEKRSANSDTGTVIERICGALLMNGIEPIHDGRSELASRMLVLSCSPDYRSLQSPPNEEPLMRGLYETRDAFWSEAARRCSEALLLSKDWGTALAQQIEVIFGETRIGRLSSYLSVMYLAWVSGQPAATREAALNTVDETWTETFRSIAGSTMESLIQEELAVTALRHAFHFGRLNAEETYKGSNQWVALDHRYLYDGDKNLAALGELRASSLARLVRRAGKELNAPRSLSTDLRAGQLEQRILDGRDYLRAAGIEFSSRRTRKGRLAFTFHREEPTPPPPPNEVHNAGDDFLDS